MKPTSHRGVGADISRSICRGARPSEPRKQRPGSNWAEADALYAGTISEAIAGVKGPDANARRLLLRLEGSWVHAFEGGATLTPSLEIGARHDGGDAETGFGADVGGGIVLADPRSGFSLALNARGLLAHEASGFREWGVSGALRYDPDPVSERGLSLTLTPSWGAASTGGADALFGRETLAGLSRGRDAAGPRGSARNSPTASLCGRRAVHRHAVSRARADDAGRGRRPHRLAPRRRAARRRRHDLRPRSRPARIRRRRPGAHGGAAAHHPLVGGERGNRMR